MTDDRRRTILVYGPLLLLAVIAPAMIYGAVEQWRLSEKLVRLERLVRDVDARQHSANAYVNVRQQELAAEVEALRLKGGAPFPPDASGKDGGRAADGPDD